MVYSIAWLVEALEEFIKEREFVDASGKRTLNGRILLTAIINV